MGRTIARKVFVVAGLIGVTLLGNLRLQASEVTVRQPRVQAVPRVSTDHREVDPAVAFNGPAVADATFEPSQPTDTVDALGPDDVRLVPAIYSWDPDVRFVFFRHVSKWM